MTSTRSRISSPISIGLSTMCSVCCQPCSGRSSHIWPTRSTTLPLPVVSIAPITDRRGWYSDGGIRLPYMVPPWVGEDSAPSGALVEVVDSLAKRVEVVAVDGLTAVGRRPDALPGHVLRGRRVGAHCQDDPLVGVAHRGGDHGRTVRENGARSNHHRDEWVAHD